MASPAEIEAFPVLTAGDLDRIRDFASVEEFADGATIFRAGDRELDLLVVEEGGIEIQNPSDGHGVIVTHGPGQFAGDIDLLTGRPVIVTGVARGPTRVLRIPSGQLRILLNRVPNLGETLIVATTRRRELLGKTGRFGIRVVGPPLCRETNIVREFLYKNFYPFTWFDPATPAGQRVCAELGNPSRMPAIGTADGEVLVDPPLRELATRIGIWRACPNEEVDFAIIGAGPAGIAAAVYSASEGLSTLLIDRLGPGGQAGGSSRIENFIGFPAGLSGADLATRGVLRLLQVRGPDRGPRGRRAGPSVGLARGASPPGARLRCRGEGPRRAARDRGRVAEARGGECRSIRGGGRPLRLHERRGDPLRRLGRGRHRRRQLGGPGRGLSLRVLPRPDGPPARPARAGPRDVGIPGPQDPRRGEHHRP